MKVGAVIQSLTNARPLRLGNTYRIERMSDNYFTVRYFNGTLPYSTIDYPIDAFDALFTIIPDTLCPSCLTSSKEATADWCKLCSED